MAPLLQTLLLALTAATATLATPTARDTTSAIIGTFDDGACAANQRDWSDGVSSFPGVGACHELPGGGAKIWWVKKGCVVLLFKADSTCKVNPDSFTTAGECIDTSKYLSWTTYCS